MRLVTEEEFNNALRTALERLDLSSIGSVTGPGRSGAVASVYASHMLGIPFIPYGSRVPSHLGSLLIVDTAMESGRTMRKAERRYRDALPVLLAVYHEPPRVYFWYEASKPQRYRHEQRTNS